MMRDLTAQERRILATVALIEADTAIKGVRVRIFQKMRKKAVDTRSKND